VPLKGNELQLSNLTQPFQLILLVHKLEEFTNVAAKTYLLGKDGQATRVDCFLVYLMMLFQQPRVCSA
jgi:hypothetical protein